MTGEGASARIECQAEFHYFATRKENVMDQQSMSPSTAAVQPSSLASRAADVFASPSSLFTEVAAAPVRSSSWVMPLILSLCLALAFTYTIYNNPNLRQQVYDMQEQAFKKAVEKGSMTQEQAQQATERMESTGLAMFMVFGGGLAVVTITAVFFLAPLVIWALAKFILKYGGAYMKLLEIWGLASFIGILGTIITLLLMSVFDSMHASPGGGLLVMGSYDANSVAHRFLVSMNLITIWQVAVLGIGVGTVSGGKVGKGLAVMFGLWLLWVIISAVTGFGAR